MSKNIETAEIVDETVVEEPKKSVLTKIKETAAKHSGKIKIAAAAAAGAIGYAILTNLQSKDEESEDEDQCDFDGSDEETVTLSVETN